MVEIMKRRQEAEWTPDMELDGSDAEKAAALLLSVGPICRSRSFDTTAPSAEGQEDNGNDRGATDQYKPKRVYNGGAKMAMAPSHSSQQLRSSEYSLPQVVENMVEVSPNGSPSTVSLSPRSGPVGHVTPRSGVSDNEATGCSGIAGGRPRALMRAEEDAIGLLSSGRSGFGGGRVPEGGTLGMDPSVPVASSSPTPITKMEVERTTSRSGRAGHPGGHVASRSLVNTASAVAAASAGIPSPRRAQSAGDLLSGHSSMLLLAEFATQELLTMDDGQPQSSGGTSSRTPPAMWSPNRDQSPRATSAVAAPPPPQPPARIHGHHLRDRSAISRNRSGSSPDDDDDDDDERRAYSRGGRGENGGGGSQRRRSRPRSVSMPVDMELHATRAWGRGHSSGGRNDSKIEAIEEERDGQDGTPGTRSRTWKSGAGGSSSSGRKRGNGNEPLFGSIEDAEALIGLGRHHGRWCGIADKDEDVRESALVGPSGDGERVEESSSSGGVEGEDGMCVSLPHMLAKYADMYNKNGRIGIYTRQEREAIIARFKRKRGRRVWKKKIRYNCRKNLADKRLRIKGRFVKMSPEQKNLLKLKQKALRAAGARGGAAASRTDSSTFAGSMDMELLVSGTEENGSSVGSGSGTTGEGFEDDAIEDPQAGDEDDDEDEEDEEEEDEEDTAGGAAKQEGYPQEPPKRVRRHSIAY